MDVTDPPLTIMVSRVVAPANREPFEAAMRALTEASSAFPGHLGVSVFRPGPGQPAYRILFRFDAKSRYETWQGDSGIRGLVAAADALTEGEATVDTLTGLEAWFTIPGQTPPPRIKMAALTWAALFPLVSLLLTVLRPLTLHLPFLAGTLLVTGLVTAAMTWLVMPRLTRLAAPWLFGGRR